MTRRAGFFLVACCLAGCPGPIPETHHYALRVPSPAERVRGCAVLAVEELEVISGYDDERIVYRTSPYRLDYYNYHRWSSPPSLHVTDYLREAYARSGHFIRVTRQRSAAAPVVLSGRLIALEEVNVTEEHWVGRVELELWMTDARTGDVLRAWRFQETEPLDERSPEGLARGLSVALARVVEDTAEEVAAVAEAAGPPGPQDETSTRGTAAPRPCAHP